MNFSAPLTKSLRTKIFLRFTLLSGMAIAVTGLLSLLMLKTTIENKATQDLFTLIERGETNLERVINDEMRTTRMIGLQLQNTLLPESRTELQQIQTLSPEVLLLAITDPAGIVISATDSRLEGEDLSFLPHVQQGAERTYRDIFTMTHRTHTSLIATPIRSAEGVLRGILLVEFESAALVRALSGQESVGVTAAFLLHENGKEQRCYNPHYLVFSQSGFLQDALLYRETPRPENMPGESSALCNKTANGQAGVLRANNAAGVSSIAVARKLPNAGITLIATMELWEAWEPVRLLVAMLAGSTGILLLFVTLVALRLSHDVIHPIRVLQGGVSAINAGHLHHEQRVRTGDELQELDRDIGALADRLRESYSSLEERVSERTQELASANAKDAALIESIGEGFLAIDLHGAILTVNRSAEEMLQWDREEMIGNHFSSILHLKENQGKPLAPDAHVIRRALQDRMAVRTPPTEHIHCERKDGSLFPVEIIATPFLLDMRVQGVVVTMRDVTEEERIDRMKSEFISLASHQLRTPLTAIGWYIELLQNESANLTDDQREYAAQILSSHKRMVELVNSLLNVSRIELGHVRIEPKEMTIAELISVPHENLQREITERKIRYKEHFPKMKVQVDPDLVRMVIENLLSNAVKYTPDNGSVTLSVVADGEQLRISVEDTGIGIPTTEQGRIFEKLFRAGNVTKTDTEGTGIGLYIAKNAVESWGGTLWFRSVEGKGTSFSFTLPKTMKAIGGEEKV